MSFVSSSLLLFYCQFYSTWFHLLSLIVYFYDIVSCGPCRIVKYLQYNVLVIQKTHALRLLPGPCILEHAQICANIFGNIHELSGIGSYIADMYLAMLFNPLCYIWDMRKCPSSSCGVFLTPRFAAFALKQLVLLSLTSPYLCFHAVYCKHVSLHGPIYQLAIDLISAKYAY